MEFINIVDWLSELRLDESDLKALTSISLLANKEGCINCGEHSPEAFLYKENVLIGRTEKNIYNLLNFLDRSDCIAYEAKMIGDKLNRLTLLI